MHFNTLSFPYTFNLWWSKFCTCIDCILYYLLFCTYEIFRWKKREVFLLICTLGYSIGGFFLGYKLHLPVIGLKWYPESLGLTLGIIIAYHYDRINLFFKRNIALKTVIMFAVAFFLKYSYTHYIYKYYFIGNYIYRMLMGISVIVFITLLLTHIKLGNPLSTKLGDLSLKFFCIMVSFAVVNYPSSSVDIEYIYYGGICMHSQYSYNYE